MFNSMINVGLFFLQVTCPGSSPFNCSIACLQCSRELTCKHEPKDKPTTVSPLKRVNISFFGTLSYDSLLRKKKKALTKSALNPSLGSGKTKKTLSHTFKTVGVSRRRELEMVEHKKRVTALKLKSVA